MPSDRNPLIERGTLQLLLDPGSLRRSPSELLREAIAGGVDLIQLRMKSATTLQRIDAARSLAGVLESSGVPLLINDDVEAAAALGGVVAGVHLGQGDLPVEVARSRLGPTAWIGLSTHSRAEIEAGNRTSATHFGLGACFATATKRDHLLLSRAELSAALAAAARPLFAIGGIELGNVGELVALGVRRIAVSRALVEAADPRATARAFRNALGSAPTT